MPHYFPTRRSSDLPRTDRDDRNTSSFPREGGGPGSRTLAFATLGSCFRRSAGAMTKISPERIAQIEARRDELQALMATGDLPGDRFVQVSKEYAELEPVAAAAGDVRRLRAEAESQIGRAHV